MSKRRFYRNLSPGLLIMAVPVFFALVAAAFVFSAHYQRYISVIGAARLTTKNWQVANSAFLQHEQAYDRKFTYYQVRPSEDLAFLANHFGITQKELTDLNPGQIVAGTTIRIPPVEQPLQPDTDTNTNYLTIQNIQGVIYVSNTHNTNPQVQLTLPTLAQLLKPYNVIEQTGPKTYRLMQPLYVKGRIRLYITGDTVSKLELKSNKNYDVTALSLWNAEALIENTTITTVDTASNEPDVDYIDGRSFVRAYGDSRLDVINSHLSYLGMGLAQLRDRTIAKKIPFVSQGGIYGVSWRIPNGSFGRDVVTGWVQNSSFDHNYIGGFTFGASGMMWKHNEFLYNDIYGLDPHDDSNNALVENNTFAYNGKHGFIVSKRCDYNIIRNNTSHDNKLNGFMLHENSAYNLLSNNLAYNNTDNFVIYQSNFNQLLNNKAYHALSSAVRINQGATNNYIIGNTLIGGKRGIYLYGEVTNAYISGNIVDDVGQLLETTKAQQVLFINNTLPNLTFKLADGDRVIFGPNSIKPR